ncbi:MULTISPECIES: hypothetical protein [Kitasatospora]|uniref:Uncharacterized protein n=1 Tax=Kitasatospora setae (strain ATCC 33774 / DSM 43861 / JCM 3304 / KCC A-0304 / NBRC 14216 / KM-6054) TaxID=452652 RepID=E4N4E8_KITSK|nr:MULTISPECIES: hypothetical protein [Kitasatospora]BAJ26079.1 hypothetical protein KSE_02280 [Kitasatospora setae KM-6054]
MADPVPDHRPLVRALLAAAPASYRGTERLRTRSGGQAHRVSGRLTEHAVADCATDLLVDTAGRLAELEVDCAAFGDGYRFKSTLTLGEYGPATKQEPPSDS